jgi:hypothetical protein
MAAGSAFRLGTSGVYREAEVVGRSFRNANRMVTVSEPRISPAASKSSPLPSWGQAGAKFGRHSSSARRAESESPGLTATILTIGRSRPLARLSNCPRA